MALSFVQKPVASSHKIPVITNWNPVVGYMLYESSISGLFYFKLVLEVYIGSSATASRKIAKLKQRRNGYDADVSGNRARAYFDLRDVVNSQLVDTVYDQPNWLNNDTQLTIHKIGANDDATIYSWNGDGSQTYGDDSTPKTQLVQIHVVGYQNYSEAANESPIDRESVDSVTHTKWWTMASLPLLTPRDTDTQYLQSSAFDDYQLKDSGAYLLTDVQKSAGAIKSGTSYRNYVQDTDYHTIGFLNGETDFESLGKFFAVEYYDSDNAIIVNSSDASTVNYFENKYTNGGAKPQAGVEVDTDKERLLYFGCGPSNLQEQNVNYLARPSYFPNWVYYKIYAADAGTGTPNKKSNSYYFFKQDGSCKGFKVRRLAWRNSLGCWDYFNFKMKSEQSIKIERNTYSNMLGNFNREYFTYNDSQRGKATRQTTAMLQETLNTDWLTEQDAQLLEKLLVSTNVEMVENADTTYTQPVMVTDSSFVRKTVANDKMIQYTIKIDYANNINTNS
tara:strand:- start:1632 stop:3146 length:1515 start_codon:yes stop_codon:yes gene_type:complete